MFYHPTVSDSLVRAENARLPQNFLALPPVQERLSRIFYQAKELAANRAKEQTERLQAQSSLLSILADLSPSTGLSECETQFPA